jgi:alpha/beta superfamily hydrolase
MFTVAMLLAMSPLNAKQSVEIQPGLVGVLHEPDRTAAGLVVIAPGAGYDMSQPLMTDAAEVAASLGYRALRFNWRYFTEGTERGNGIENEVRDLKEVIQYLSASTSGDLQLVLIGKSLGSIVVANVAAEDSYPAILLTPICRTEAEFKNFYKLSDKTQVMIAGDQDPLCDTDVLFSHVHRSTKISILKGDHGFDGASTEQAERNRAAVSKIVAYWLESWRLP